MNNYKKQLQLKLTLAIIIFSSLIINTLCRTAADTQCILQNTYWDSIISKEDFIKDPTQCHNVSSNCCYMNINYTYNTVPFSFSYCFTMTGAINDIVNKFVNLIQDDLRYYANYTYNNYQIFSNVGTNLDYVYNSNYNCTTPVPYQEWSSYNITFCALFNADGSCAIVNDDDNFDNFSQNIYENITTSQCGFTAADGTCMGIGNINLFNSTSSAMLPLLENLKIALNVDGGGNPISNGTQSGMICQPMPLVTVTVKCPDDYSFSRYLKAYTYLLYFVLIFLI